MSTNNEIGELIAVHNAAMRAARVAESTRLDGIVASLTSAIQEGRYVDVTGIRTFSAYVFRNPTTGKNRHTTVPGYRAFGGEPPQPITLQGQLASANNEGVGVRVESTPTEPVEGEAFDARRDDVIATINFFPYKRMVSLVLHEKVSAEQVM